MPTKLADRVTELEHDVADLKAALRQTGDAFRPRTVLRDAWRKTAGAFKDDPIYDEIVRLGAADRRRQPKC